MIKKISINKIVVASVSLALLTLFHFFPGNDISHNFEVIYEQNGNIHEIYMLDKEGYVSKLETVVADNNKEELIRNKLIILRDGCSKLKNFTPLLPQNTKINSVIITQDTVDIDFSSDILKVNQMIEEKMIEAIIFSLTEIDGINKINIFVEGKLLDKLPNSQKIINYPLTREYGINKEYDITKTNNITKTTIFFVKENDENYYYVPVTKISNSDAEKIDIIISELKSSVNYQSNLYSFISNNLKLESYEMSKEAMNLIFNDYIFDSLEEENILEQVKYTISLSVMENYDVKEVVFLTSEKKVIENVSKIE